MINNDYIDILIWEPINKIILKRIIIFIPLRIENEVYPKGLKESHSKSNLSPWGDIRSIS